MSELEPEKDEATTEASPTLSKPRSRASRFVLRGLAISLPPILTLVILIWIFQVIHDYIIHPTSTAVRFTIAQIVKETVPLEKVVKMKGIPPLDHIGHSYRVTPELESQLIRWRDHPEDAPDRERPENGTFPKSWIKLADVYVPMGEQAVPYRDYEEVAQRLRPMEMPTTALGLYMELVTTRYFKSLFNLSAVAVAIAIVLLYFLGGMMTNRVGRWAVNKVENVFMSKLPFVSNVYSSVKQVTDFFFTERTVSYNRVVALEYPRRGIWSLGFVTSDSMLDLTAATGEPMISVLMPTSPMPMTGFTVSLPRSQVVDIDISVDQAFQFCLSCGVLIPQQQKVTPEVLQDIITRRLAGSQPPIGSPYSQTGQILPHGYVPNQPAEIHRPDPDSPEDEF